MLPAAFRSRQEDMMAMDDFNIILLFIAAVAAGFSLGYGIAEREQMEREAKQKEKENKEWIMD